MKLSTFLALGTTTLLLAACGSDRPVYSGHEESTAGVPGFSTDGTRKLSPYVKLGQSYRVGGTTYVPRYQPDYVEEGMASWYGPGFHGGKTANGEIFSTHDYTAAHTTLPLPSIVKVTYLKTGRSAYVRINDRGPFAHGRIIDLSKAAADDIGLSREGVGKVRVEYMPAESQKLVEMIVAGRDPSSINITSELIGQQPEGTQYADVMPPDGSVEVTDIRAVTPKPNMWQKMNPIGTAQAAEISDGTIGTDAVTVTDTMPPAQAVLMPSGPPVVIMPAPAMAVPATMTPAIITPTPAPIAVAPNQPILVTGDTYVQLGAFANEANALTLQRRAASLGAANIVPGSVNGAPVYRVRIGPFANDAAAMETLEHAQQMGVGDAKLVTAVH